VGGRPRRLARAIALALPVAALVTLEVVPRAEGEPPSGGVRVATIGGDPVTSADLSAFWYARYRESWWRAVLNLADERILAREARRLGIGVPPGAVAKAVDEEVEARREQLRAAFGEGADLEAELLRTYGLALDAWRREILTPRIETQLLLVRLVRLDTRRRARVHARVIVLPDEAGARRVLEKVRAGADFSLTAHQESIDPTREAGGDLPTIARGDLALPGVEERLWEAPVGGIVGPLAVAAGRTTQWHLYKVVARIEPWAGDRAGLLQRLEKDLEEHPMGLQEYERWRARMHRDFRVEVLDPSGRPVLPPSLAGAAR
jgi:hypothetical protein